MTPATVTTKMLVPLLLTSGLTAGACATPSHDATLAGQDRATPTTSSSGPVAPDRGEATGNLILEGGPPRGGNPRPLSGTVAFIRDGRTVAIASVGEDGKFSQILTPGVYLVQACTARIQMVTPDGSHVDGCGPLIHTAIGANHTTTVQMPPFIVP